MMRTSASRATRFLVAGAIGLALLSLTAARAAETPAPARRPESRHGEFHMISQRSLLR